MYPVDGSVFHGFCSEISFEFDLDEGRSLLFRYARDRREMVDKTAQRVQKMFSGVARHYDRLNHLLSLNTDRYWRWKTVRQVPPRHGPVLDVCAGTGDLALGYFRYTEGTLDIYAADFCHEMLEIGKEKSGKAGALQCMRFIEADAERLPFPDNTFELVSVAFGLRNIADTERGLREMPRVCQSGGKIAVLEFSMPRFPLLKKMYAFYFQRVLPYIGQKLSRSSQEAYHYLPESVLEFPEGEQLAQLMRHCDLVDVHWNRMTAGVVTLYSATKP